MASTIRSTTQQKIDVEDVVDDIVIQKDGSCSLVLKTTAVNFGLLSEEEQDATIYAYAAFLNSLTFSIQILIRSDIKDISGYLKLLEEQDAKQTSPQKKMQIRSYKNFISSLITERNVLEKSFYVVVPFSTLELGIGQSFTAAFTTKKRTLPFEKSYIIEKAKATLEPKRDHVLRQMARVGLSAKQLNTQELIQLLFSMYNASSTQGQKITDTNEYTVPLVQPAYIRPITTESEYREPQSPPNLVQADDQNSTEYVTEVPTGDYQDIETAPITPDQNIEQQYIDNNLQTPESLIASVPDSLPVQTDAPIVLDVNGQVVTDTTQLNNI